MSSPLDPLWSVRIDPVSPSRRVTRRSDREDDGGGRKHSDETPEEQEAPDDDDGLHIDVLA
ncbi:MAG TPA: hypothetical protein VG652_09655 [Gaiellaceae bacterium]|nr:hypothetical protein [Gaiellaceae bacterium]